MNIPSLESLVDIVKEAAGLMVTDGFDISQKDGFANIVTSSDVAVQSFLCDRLAALLPESGFLCEEEDMNDTSRELTWIIDPIDGTANYSRGIAQCAISVALKHAADIVLGVVYLPRTGELFTARRGCGAWLNGRRITVSARPFANAVMCTALPVYHKEHTGLCSGHYPRRIHAVQRHTPFSGPPHPNCAIWPWGAANCTSNICSVHGTLRLHHSL